jgi:hypothetical protein
VLHLDRYCIPLFPLYVWEVPSKTIFARKQTRDKRDGGIILNMCCKEIWLNVIVTDRNIWNYIFTRKLVQYDILLGTIIPNISAITLYYRALKSNID